MSNLPVIALNGPTASGKTAVAVAIAKQLSALGIAAEVVNADSMLVYRGMDIGTAKPTLAERGGVPHHLIDIMEVTQTASVADFQQLARTVIADCRSRAVAPILVGGSALYVHAILDEFSFPATDAQLRARLEADLAQLGPLAMHERLRQRSATVAEAIEPGNGRRIVRALEAVELTGQFRAQLPQWSYALGNVVQYGLELPRPVLDARIESRVDQMWADGLVAEVRSLAANGLRDGLTASRAIGYRQVLAMIDGGLSQDEAIRLTKKGTRRLARKQLSWFRRDDRIIWLPADLGAATTIATVVAANVQAGIEEG